MLERLEDVELKYEELSVSISDPQIIADRELWAKRMKEYSDMTPIIDAYREYKKTQSEIEDALALLEEKLEDDFRDMVKEELASHKVRLEELKKELTFLMTPKDPNDAKNVIIEIRGGAGGDEAALFAADLFRMYSRYAERLRWAVEIMNTSENDIGGFKEISFMIKGNGAYSKLKFESGVHRVQRIPVTESGGRIHTSTVTVAVLPEAEEFDVNIDKNDLRIDVFRSSGNGGQCVNTTDSAVRVTHIPSGIVVSCQNEKSQLKNKAQALKVLYARLYEMEHAKFAAEISADRKSQVGSGNRNERIRTYNFPQGRVTDHRVGLTLHRLDSVLDGDMEEITAVLIRADHADRLHQDEA